MTHGFLPFSRVANRGGDIDGCEPGLGSGQNIRLNCTDQHGEQIAHTPRAVLKRVVSLYEERGWRPIVAPELEFFLAAKNIDPDYPLLPPAGKTGRPQTGRQAYGIDAVNEFAF